MSTSSNDFFYGWDLLYKTIESVVNKKDDLLIALAHFVLTKHSQFKCIGIGDDKTLTDDEEDNGSELLPNNWNDDDINYALRYTSNKELYILLGLRTEGSLVITLLEVKTRKVSNICLDSEELIKATKGNLKSMIPTASHLANRYHKELLEPIFSGTSKTVTKTIGASTSSQDNDPLQIGEPRIPPFGLYTPSSQPTPFGYPVGRGDLDPLGRGGGGNLFPFPSHPDFRFGPDNSGFGPGARPRPRFDPFGPPERGIRANPNPDHLPPPGFGSDYYM